MIVNKHLGRFLFKWMHVHKVDTMVFMNIYGNIVEQNVMETRTLKLTMQRVKLFIIHSELRMVAP